MYQNQTWASNIRRMVGIQRMCQLLERSSFVVLWNVADFFTSQSLHTNTLSTSRKRLNMSGFSIKESSCLNPASRKMGMTWHDIAEHETRLGDGLRREAHQPNLTQHSGPVPSLENFTFMQLMQRIFSFSSPIHAFVILFSKISSHTAKRAEHSRTLDTRKWQ